MTAIIALMRKLLAIVAKNEAWNSKFSLFSRQSLPDFEVFNQFCFDEKVRGFEIG